MSDPDILRELVAIRTALEALPGAIVQAIARDLIEQEAAPETPAAPAGCTHPPDKRVDLGDDEWACTVRGCGYHHVPETSRLGV